MFNILNNVFRLTTAAVGILLLCLFWGCQPGTTGYKRPVNTEDESAQIVAYTDYTPVKSEIMPLTEMTFTREEGTKIKAYISLLDSSGSQIKAPGIFRFEIYEFVPRSAVPKGKRLFIWPDVDLRAVDMNNKQWRDFLRAYEFDLIYQKGRIQSAVLELTCLCPDGKRLSSELHLEAKNQ